MRVSIKAKLAGAFALVLTLFAVTAYVSMQTLADNQATLERLVDRNAERVRLAGELRQSIMQIARYEKNAVITSDEARVERQIERVEEEKARITDLESRLRALISDENRPILDEFVSQYQEYLISNSRVLDLSRLNSNGRATKISSNEARGAWQNLERNLANLVELAETEVSLDQNAFVKAALQFENDISDAYSN